MAYTQETVRLPVATPLPAGSLLQGRFVILHCIAMTALSELYLAIDVASKRTVAIKRLVPHPRPGGLPFALAVTLARREARLLCALRHPQVPLGYVSFTDRSGHYLVLEYIRGRTLDRVVASGTLDEAQAYHIAEVLCAVVAYLHHQPRPIVHSDLKLENIMRANDGRIVLLDFGLARYLDEQQAGEQPVGTPEYAPPEQQAGLPLDPRSDVYALGMLLRELHPWPRRIQRVLDRATALDPRCRFANAHLLWLAFCWAYPRQQRTARQRRNLHRVCAVLAILCAVVLRSVALSAIPPISLGHPFAPRQPVALEPRLTPIPPWPGAAVAAPYHSHEVTAR